MPGAPRNRVSKSSRLSGPSRRAGVSDVLDDVFDDACAHTSDTLPAAAARCATVSATHARCNANGCEGSSHRSSSPTLRSSSLRPGTPGPGSETSRTKPGLPGSRDAVAEMGLRRGGAPSGGDPTVPSSPQYAVSTGT